MNKKGFTLIELMGIIIILSLISLLVIPTIDKSIKLFKENAYNNQIKNIQLATKNWGSDHLYNYRFNNGDVITVTLGQLKSQAYINDNLKNPLTGYLFPDDMLIHIVKGVKKITYVVEDGTGTPNFNPYNANSPTIYLNGSYVEEVYQGKIYLDKGVIAQTSTGTLITAVTKVITKDGLTVGSVNTAILGTYLISYSVTDSSLTRTAFRTVVVSVVPTIIVTRPKLTTVQVLVVAGGGGGGGGYQGGGAGGGGLIYNSSYSVTTGAFITVTVGNGGLGIKSGIYPTNGGNSVFGSLTAIGGGLGANEIQSMAMTPNNGPTIGGSGGAGSHGVILAGAAGTSLQGYAGGNGWSATSQYLGGGGGGAGSVGANATATAGGAGGSGLSNSITGSPIYYAGGGGGSSRANVSGPSGLGGSGGGGNANGIGAGSNGQANTGGGGGAGGFATGTGPGGDGGSGIVIVRYSGTQKAADGGTVTSSGGYVIHTFGAIGTYIFEVW